jgi:DNA-binding Lrp family transcriptional regulator
MDALDHAILQRLAHDARRPYAEVARELGVSQPTVAERVRRMEERGVILGAMLRLDHAKLGYPKNRSYPGAASAVGGVGRPIWPTMRWQM